MLKHIIFALYLLAYTVGIGAFTTGLLLYFSGSKKTIMLKYYLYANLFSTVNMFFYTLYYYGDLVHLNGHQWFWPFIIYGLLFSFLETGRWLSLTVNKVVGKELCYWQKKSYLTLMICTIFAIIITNTLKDNGILSNYFAVLTSFIILDLYCAVIVVYNLIALWKNRDKLNKDMKTMASTVSTAVVLWQIVTLSADLMECVYGFQCSIRDIFSLLYFVINIIAIFCVTKHYYWNESEKYLEQGDPEILQPNYEPFCQKHGITGREMEVILLAADGMSNQDIANALYISLNTVRNHIHNAYKKLGIKSRYELINILK